MFNPVQLTDSCGTLTRQGIKTYNEIDQFFQKLYDQEMVVDLDGLTSMIVELSSSIRENAYIRRRSWDKKIQALKVMTSECGNVSERVRTLLANGYKSRLELTKYYRWVFNVSLADANRVIRTLIDEGLLLKDSSDLLYWRTP